MILQQKQNWRLSDTINPSRFTATNGAVRLLVGMSIAGNGFLSWKDRISLATT